MLRSVHHTARTVWLGQVFLCFLDSFMAFILGLLDLAVELSLSKVVRPPRPVLGGGVNWTTAVQLELLRKNPKANKFITCHRFRSWHISRRDSPSPTWRSFTAKTSVFWKNTENFGNVVESRIGFPSFLADFHCFHRQLCWLTGYLEQLGTCES